MKINVKIKSVGGSVSISTRSHKKDVKIIYIQVLVFKQKLIEIGSGTYTVKIDCTNNKKKSLHNQEILIENM